MSCGGEAIASRLPGMRKFRWQTGETAGGQMDGGLVTA